MERLKLGVIGVSGQGRLNLESCIRENVVAVCDVDSRARDQAILLVPQAKQYADYRRMLDHERLDGVVIATPDHTHAVIAVHSMQAGAHVFCSEPLSHTISEARIIAKTAKKTRRITQMGGCFCSQALEDVVIAAIRSGAVGALEEVTAFSQKSHGELSVTNAPRQPPSEIEYDLWLGPSLKRSYRSEFLLGRWRHWWHFGGGTLCDSGARHFALIHRVLNVSTPIKIQSQGPALHLQQTPPWLLVRYEYQAKNSAALVPVIWRHGTPTADVRPFYSKHSCNEAVVFSGKAGHIVLTPSRAIWISSDEKNEEPLGNDLAQDLETVRLCEWFEACKATKTTAAGFDFASAVTETILLGNVAFRTDRKLVWDTRKMAAINLPEASEFVEHNYREGWWI